LTKRLINDHDLEGNNRPNNAGNYGQGYRVLNNLGVNSFNNNNNNLQMGNLYNLTQGSIPTNTPNRHSQQSDQGTTFTGTPMGNVSNSIPNNETIHQKARQPERSQILFKILRTLRNLSCC